VEITPYQPSSVAVQNTLVELKDAQAEIKRLKFDLDMERGHVNILKHDNYMLRQSAVELVLFGVNTNESSKRVPNKKKSTFPTRY
jgi:hypothetical protein